MHHLFLAQTVSQPWDLGYCPTQVPVSVLVGGVLGAGEKDHLGLGTDVETGHLPVLSPTNSPLQEAERSCGTCGGQVGEHCGGPQQEKGCVERPSNRGAGGRSAIKGQAEERKIQGQDTVQSRT